MVQSGDLVTDEGKNIFHILAQRPRTEKILKILFDKILTEQNGGSILSSMMSRNSWEDNSPIDVFIRAKRIDLLEVIKGYSNQLKDHNIHFHHSILWVSDKSLDNILIELCQKDMPLTMKDEKNNKRELTVEDIKEHRKEASFSNAKIKINDCLNTQLSKELEKKLYENTKFLTQAKEMHRVINEKTNICHAFIKQQKFVHLEITLKAMNNIGLEKTVSFLFILFMKGNEELLEFCANNFLIKNFPKDLNGQNLLHYACKMSNIKIVKILIERGVNIEFKDKEGKTAFDYAYNKDIVQLLTSKMKNKELAQKQFKEKLIEIEIREKKKEEIRKELEKQEEKNRLAKEEKEKTNGLKKTNKFEEIYELLHPKEGNNTNLTAAQLCQEKDVRIEEYKIFASKKEKLLKSDIVEEEIHYWNIDNNTQYSSKDMICHEYAGKKWYFFTDFKLNKQEELAFNGEFVSREKGQNGIKLLNNKSIIEIKTSAEERIYTDHYYENPKGAILVIFDKSGNHKKVASEAKEGKLEKVEVTDLAPIKTPPSEENHNNSSSSEESNCFEDTGFIGDNSFLDEN
jgi:hypothetical protein